MIERITVITAAALAALSLSACGDGTAAPGGAGARPSSEEPIDAVPLPFDALPAAAPEPAPVAAASETTPAAAEETAAPGQTADPAPPLALDPAPRTPRVVVPREPSRPIERPVERPVPDPTQPSEGDKPVLTF
jgi:hypothetical protein